MSEFFDSGSKVQLSGDVEIGAVEIKDSSTDQRVSVNASGQLSVTVDNNPVLGASSAAIGKLAANDGVNIGLVDARLKGFDGLEWDNLKSGYLTPSITSLAGMLNGLPWAVYNASPTARTEGQGGPLQATSTGGLNVNSETLIEGEDQTNHVMKVIHLPLAASTYAASLFQNLGANATLNVKASAGNVFTVTMDNVSGATRYLQLHNTATTPAGAAVPAWVSPAIPAGGSIILGPEFFTAEGLYFSTGIAFACSTTAATYTAATATDHITHVRWI